MGLLLEATATDREGSGDGPELAPDVDVKANPTLRDGDILVISSKVVSLAEGRYVDLEAVPVSSRADRIADVTGIDPREVELILRESTVLGAIPIADIGPGVDRLEDHAVDPEAASAALESLPSLLVTFWNGRFCTNAGIDLSNSPGESATLLPADPNASARRIREEIRDRAGIEVAVIVADSELSYRGGSVDVAIGCAGIDPVDSNFGATDLFGTPKLGGVDLQADELAAASALLSGQAAERTPIVVARGLDYEVDDDVAVGTDSDLIRGGLWPVLKRTIQVKIADTVPIRVPFGVS
ncbi:coenzyme F420-0:L-glutamate ligase [Salinadaptatus halalkaliphilus]|uniref:coenzyme F420-0:L-glutamate ligase n=1 Tax=Salinadaptatus halalkaliphilus TaxID=2419781 RepID=UPI0015801D6B|nr:coenzyme F420-0:L-glutamate ligase [Salinadaptatus halalkaliphilus]